MSIVESSDPPAGWIKTIMNPSPKTARMLFLAPLMIASAITLYVACYSMYYRLTLPYPVDPWESMFIMDATRATHGLAVYEKLPAGHATHMYGPLGTYALAVLFHFTGTTVNGGRWISLIAGLAASVLFIFAFVERRTFSYLLIGAAIFISLHIRCVDLFTNTRPDALAFFIASLGLFAAYRAQKLDAIFWYVVAAMLIVIAFLVKQTYSVAALVPIVAIFFTRPEPFRRRLITSMIPLAAIAIAGIVLKFGFPLIWFYAIHVPRLYPIRGARIPLGFESIFLYNPIWLAVAVLILFTVGIDTRRDHKTAWLAAAMLIGTLMGIIAFSKQGGTFNSMLMVFAPISAYTMLKLPEAIEIFTAARLSRLLQAVCAISLAFMLTGTAFAVPLSMRLAFDHSSNTPNYAKAIEIAKSLDGPVSCPDEPTITYFAHGTFDKNLEAEVEAVGTGRRLAGWLRNYFHPVKYVITAGTTDISSKTNVHIATIGFRPVRDKPIGDGYTLWARPEAAPTSAATHPAAPRTTPAPRPTR